jgi:MoaA/NifB/PqqE/SkfB family radical SAM enzyme
MQKGKALNIARNFMSGRLRCVEFALTNACIAKCSFCDIWKQKPKIFVDKEKALTAIDKLAALGVSHLTLTGGEPLLHPNIVDFVARASANHVHNAVLDAVPRLITNKDLHLRLEEAGCDLISISFDSGDAETMAASRQVEGIMEEIEQTVATLKRTTKLQTMASVLIWNNNYDFLEEVCRRAQDIGFDLVSLNYPTFSRSEVYVLGGEGISLSKEKIIDALQDSLRLKKEGYRIINSSRSIENIIAYLRGEPVKYLCFGGSRVGFLDWFFDLRPCMQLPGVLGNIHELQESDLNRPACNDCNMSWYRDFSAFFHGVPSLPLIRDALADARQMF